MNSIAIDPTIADLFLLPILEKFPDYPTVHTEVHDEWEPIEVGDLDGGVAESSKGDSRKQHQQNDVINVPG